jgi:integrase
VAARRGTYVDRTNLTVRDYLVEWQGVHGPSLKPKTASGYRHIIERYVLPHLGSTRLQAVKASTLTRLYAALLAGGGKDGRALSPRTVHGVHRVVHRALKYALNDDLIAVNPADGARPPKAVEREPETPWSPQELAAFLSAAGEHRLGCFYRLAAYTGARRGELLALTWSDIDFESGLISVAKSTSVIDGQRVTGSPKGGRSRVIGVDAGTMAALRNHRARQVAEQGFDPGPSALVFCQEDGAPLGPDTVTHLVPVLCRKAGVRKIRLHALRHLHATWLLTAGVPVHEVARRLGHRDAVVTLSIYAHVVSGRDDILAETFAAAAEAVDSTIDSNARATLRAV